MVDTLSPEQRSRAMARVRASNTTPELRVRRALHRRGFRFRLHVRTLPGNPDIVLPRFSVIIFVHGCFWHSHRCAAGKAAPKSRLDYWLPKLEGNKRRDRKAVRALRRRGWTVITIWECQTKDDRRLQRSIAAVGLHTAGTTQHP